MSKILWTPPIVFPILAMVVEFTDLEAKENEMVQVNLEGRVAVSKYRLRTCNYDLERWSICDSLHSMNEGHRTLWFYGEVGDRDECVVTRGDDMDEMQGDVLAFHVFTDVSIQY